MELYLILHPTLAISTIYDILFVEDGREKNIDWEFTSYSHHFYGVEMNQPHYTDE